MITKISSIIEQSVYFFVYRVFRLNLSKESYANLIQFIKFGLVGFLNNAISYITYIVLVEFGLHYTPANIIGFTVSVLNSYYWNNKYVFATDGRRVWWKTFLKTYISYAGTGIVLSNILLMLWIEILGIPEVVAPLINLIIATPINYWVNKLWAYKNK